MTSSKRNQGLFLGALAGAGAWALPALAWAQGSIAAPHDASTHGHRVDWLINITNFFSLILFVIMCVWMLLAFMKHGKKHTAEYDHGDAKKQVKKAMALSALIFFIVDGNLWINSTMDVNGLFWNFEKVEKDPNVVRIEVNARQWMWQARYAGADGKFNTEDDALSDHEIHAPVNTPILVQLASPDVIHTLALPNFRIKQDAMPGMINMMWFQGKETGTFDIACLQHCGVNHYQMAAKLKIESKEDFQKWVQLKAKDAKMLWDEKDTEAHWGWKWKKK